VGGVNFYFIRVEQWHAEFRTLAEENPIRRGTRAKKWQRSGLPQSLIIDRRRKTLFANLLSHFVIEESDRVFTSQISFAIPVAATSSAIAGVSTIRFFRRERFSHAATAGNAMNDVS